MNDAKPARYYADRIQGREVGLNVNLGEAIKSDNESRNQKRKPSAY
jgi:hypothetical protein